MIRTAITCSLVAEAKAGPFVYHEGLTKAFESAAQHGFDAIEIFAPAADAVDDDELKRLISKTGLSVAAVGTGAGMIKHGLSLCDADSAIRARARLFIRSMIEFGAKWKAPAIIGSMQGKWGGEVSRDCALNMLGESLEELGKCAAARDLPLFYEPLNRYETNLLKTVGQSVDFLRGLRCDNVQLLADLFHMNIEEADVAQAIRAGQGFIGHVHFVDSNRLAAGLGHTDFGPIISALQDIQYQGYLSVEAFPLPDADTCAKKTMETRRRFFPDSKV
jgi:sugar phosphate isomerase/epimerase